MQVEKLVYGGEGLGRVNGRVVLIPFVLPGETVRVRAAQERPGMLRARPLQITAPSSDRVSAPCPYFGRCGGCQYQHAPYSLQVGIKRTILIEELRRIGKLEPPDEIELVTGEPWAYRNRAQFHISGTELGFLELRSHRLCPIRYCPISSPKINETLSVLLHMLRDPRWPRFVHSLEIFTNEHEVQLNILDSTRPVARRFFDWCAERLSGWSPGALRYHAAGFNFNVSPRSFFQVNRYLIDRLVEVVLDGAGGDTALDLYAGVGLFSAPLMAKFRKVTAVEASTHAVRDLRLNAAGVQVNQSSAEAYLRELDKAPDFVLLDPPRAGMGRSVAVRLAELKPPFLTIVSCNPATLARDLAVLVAAGYRIQRMILVDLFPQTYHVETVAHLVCS